MWISTFSQHSMLILLLPGSAGDSSDSAPLHSSILSVSGCLTQSLAQLSANQLFYSQLEQCILMMYRRIIPQQERVFFVVVCIIHDAYKSHDAR